MLSFHVKFVLTDKRTDRRTTVKQYAPNLSIRGHKKNVGKKEEMFVTSTFSYSNNVSNLLNSNFFHISQKDFPSKFSL